MLISDDGHTKNRKYCTKPDLKHGNTLKGSRNTVRWDQKQYEMTFLV